MSELSDLLDEELSALDDRMRRLERFEAEVTLLAVSEREIRELDRTLRGDEPDDKACRRLLAEHLGRHSGRAVI